MQLVEKSYYAYIWVTNKVNRSHWFSLYMAIIILYMLIKLFYSALSQNSCLVVAIILYYSIFCCLFSYSTNKMSKSTVNTNNNIVQSELFKCSHWAIIDDIM